jgi:pSer/pThr/pTyr-binding forkhead associated (FHA) protein
MQVVLVMFRGDGERRSFSIARDMTVIGRREDCDLRIPVGDVSRKHCRMVKEADTLRIEDLGSSNGTFVNGERVQEAVLNPGDVIQVGPVQFVLQIDGVPSEDELAQPTAPAATASDDTAATTAPLPPYPQMADEQLEELPAEDEPASLDALEEVAGEEPALEEIESADQLEEVEEVANLEEVADLEEVTDLEEVEAAPPPPPPPQHKGKPAPPPVPSRKAAAAPPPPPPMPAPELEEAEAEAPAGEWDFIVDDTANSQSHTDLNIEH